MGIELTLARDYSGPAGLSGVDQRRWRPRTMMVLVVIGDKTKAQARQETANHKTCAPPADQLPLLPRIAPDAMLGE